MILVFSDIKSINFTVLTGPTNLLLQKMELKWAPLTWGG